MGDEQTRTHLRKVAAWLAEQAALAIDERPRPTPADGDRIARWAETAAGILAIVGVEPVAPGDVARPAEWAELAKAVDEAHWEIHAAEQEGASGRDAGERLLLVLGRVKGAHEALHRVEGVALETRGLVESVESATAEPQPGEVWEDPRDGEQVRLAERQWVFMGEVVKAPDSDGARVGDGVVRHVTGWRKVSTCTSV